MQKNIVSNSDIVSESVTKSNILWKIHANMVHNSDVTYKQW